MKSISATFGGTPSKREQPHAAPSQSQTRASTSTGGPIERGRWASCEGEPEALLAPAGGAARTSARAPVAERRRDTRVPAEEPRTGVVRRVDFSAGERRPGLVARSAPPSGRREQPPAPASTPRGAPSGSGSAGDWSCLEWGGSGNERLPPRRGKRNSKVTIVQLAQSGELVRQNGPDAWLPEAGDFMHRMAGLVAQGLGLSQCRSLCLRSASAVLTVAEAGPNVVAVSGPVSSMTNVLRRAGLE